MLCLVRAQWSHFNQLFGGQVNKQYELYNGYKPPPEAVGDVCLSIGVIPHLGAWFALSFKTYRVRHACAPGNHLRGRA